MIYKSLAFFHFRRFRILNKSRQVIPLLKKIAEKLDYRKLRWHSSYAFFSSLALIRMEETINLDKVIAGVELEIDKDLRVMRLLKYIAYKQNGTGFKLIQKYLLGIEKSPDAEIMDVGQYIVHYLTLNIANFPVKSKFIGAYKKEEIDISRNC